MRIDGDAIIREVPLPSGIHGMIKEDPDGYANIYLNGKDPEEKKKKTLEHELRHYRLGHLHLNEPLRQKENEADG